MFSNTNNVVFSTGNGTTGEYNFSFPIQKLDDIIVKVRNINDGAISTLTIATDFSVTISGINGGRINLINSGQAWLDVSGFLISDYEIMVKRAPSINQTSDFRNSGPYFAELHEDRFDRQTYFDQELKEAIERSAKFDEFVQYNLPGTYPRLPRPVAGHYLAWTDDEDGTLENREQTIDLSDYYTMEEVDQNILDSEENSISIDGVIAGTNITITGSGTSLDPYVVSTPGGGGGDISMPNGEIVFGSGTSIQSSEHFMAEIDAESSRIMAVDRNLDLIAQGDGMNIRIMPQGVSPGQVGSVIVEGQNIVLDPQGFVESTTQIIAPLSPSQDDHLVNRGYADKKISHLAVLDQDPSVGDYVLQKNYISMVDTELMNPSALIGEVKKSYHWKGYWFVLDSNNFVFMSTDKGQNWEQIGTNVFAMMVTENSICILDENGEFYRSDIDSGISFESVYQTGYVIGASSIRHYMTYGEYMLMPISNISFQTVFWISSNGGRSWANAGTVIPAASPIYDMAVIDDVVHFYGVTTVLRYDLRSMTMAYSDLTYEDGTPYTGTPIITTMAVNFKGYICRLVDIGGSSYVSVSKDGVVFRRPISALAYPNTTQLMVSRGFLFLLTNSTFGAEWLTYVSDINFFAATKKNFGLSTDTTLGNMVASDDSILMFYRGSSPATKVYRIDTKVVSQQSLSAYSKLIERLEELEDLNNFAMFDNGRVATGTTSMYAPETYAANTGSQPRRLTRMIGRNANKVCSFNSGNFSFSVMKAGLYEITGNSNHYRCNVARLIINNLTDGNVLVGDETAQSFTTNTANTTDLNFPISFLFRLEPGKEYQFNMAVTGGDDQRWGQQTGASTTFVGRWYKWFHAKVQRVAN